MPLQATSGAASYDGFGGGVPFTPTYIEDVFSTFLYTGNGSTQTINNGIDLAGKGGLVWIKSRAGTTGNHILNDTARGAGNNLISNSGGESFFDASTVSAFGSNGFSIGNNFSVNTTTGNSTYVSWTFRKQPKFFDVVTYTGNGTAGRTVAHSLGSVPGCIIIKRTDLAEEWVVYHRSLGTGKYMRLASTAAEFAVSMVSATSTTNFTLTSNPYVNDSGGTYVAYLFAHDAGGFGLTGTDNVISCGSYTGNGSTSGPTITLGYEPQWVMIKRSSGGVGDWDMYDVMRGFAVTEDSILKANTSDAEITNIQRVNPTATGFSITTDGSGINANGSTYIYIAIRRGPMRTPTTGTSVFTPFSTGSSGGPPAYITSFPVDMAINKPRGGNSGFPGSYVMSRLTGTGVMLADSTGSEASNATIRWDYMNGYINAVGSTTYNNWWSVVFRRAPGFFDVVCYTGTGSTNNTVNHNLGVVPEMMIVKIRNNYTAGVDASGNWAVYHAALGNQARLQLNLTNAVTTGTGIWYSTTPTATTFKTSADDLVNKSASGYVAYLFASCPGVSKVGSYTGTGATLQIDCGFTGGARFVLIKRTDGAGDWYVWDSARGIVSGNDPYLMLNSPDAEVTNTDWVDTHSPGFELSNAAGNNANINGAAYIYLAIA